MNGLAPPVAAFATAVCCFALGHSSAQANEANTRPPNVIFILADDLGWSELGSYGNRFNETPHLDRLAREGMRFTAAYAAAPVCSPYRAALLTGQYPARIGILDYLRPDASAGLSMRHVTLAEMFGRAGYATGMIGKWHLTGYRHHGAEHETRPADHGFAWDFATEVKSVGNGANFWPYIFRDQAIRWVDIADNKLGKDEFLVDRMNAAAVEFIERNKAKPFFLYLSHYAVHTILNGKPSLVEKYRRKHPPGKSTRTRCYLCEDAGHAGDVQQHWAGDHNPHLAAMLESIDEGVGRITAKLRELDIERDTLIVFTSDNGGETNVTTNAPWRGGKSQLYEGGLRVPMIVRWPGQIPAETICDQPTVNVDFYPTLLSAAGIEPDEEQTLDGIDVLAMWRNPTETFKRDAIYWHYPLDRPHFLGGRSAGAVRTGDWKLIERFGDTGGDNARLELYNLVEDPSEQHNLAQRHRELAEALADRLAAWRRSVRARQASPPVMCEARRLYFGDTFEPEQTSSRWFFDKHWTVVDGRLVRNDIEGEHRRIFIKKPEYRDVLIRFDFRLQGAQEIRLVTGTPGKYNAVIHVRPDRFFIQTAVDQTVPYFPSIQGECAFDIQQDRTYTMTVEIVGDEIAAHVDRRHFALCQHPILDRKRTYFAFQVDRSGAAIDNVEIYQAASRKDWPARRLELWQLQKQRVPIKKSPVEELHILRMNAHDRLYRNDERFRRLVAELDRCKMRQREQFPDVFRTVKEVRTEINDDRRKLQQSDSNYQQLRDRINRSRRAQRDFVLRQRPRLTRLPPTQFEAALEGARRKLADNPQLKALEQAEKQSEKALRRQYPRLFVTDAKILQQQRAARQRREADEAFRAVVRQTTDAFRAQQDYLHDAEPRLRELLAEIDAQRNDGQ